MAFDFTKLMKVADKNRQEVDGKFKTSINPPKPSLNVNPKVSKPSPSAGSAGPNADAVRQFLAKKKKQEDEEARRRQEDAKRRLVQAKKSNKPSEKKNSKQEESQPSTSNDNPKPKLKCKPGEVSREEEKRSIERNKLEAAKQLAKSKLQNGQSSRKSSENVNVSYSSSEKVGSDKSKGPNRGDMSKSSSALSNFKIPSVKISKTEPVDFQKLMHAAVKNRDPQMFHDDVDKTARRKDSKEQKRKLDRKGEEEQVIKKQKISNNAENKASNCNSSKLNDKSTKNGVVLKNVVALNDNTKKPTLPNKQASSGKTANVNNVQRACTSKQPQTQQSKSQNPQSKSKPSIQTSKTNQELARPPQLPKSKSVTSNNITTSKLAANVSKPNPQQLPRRPGTQPQNNAVPKRPIAPLGNHGLSTKSGVALKGLQRRPGTPPKSLPKRPGTPPRSLPRRPGTPPRSVPRRPGTPPKSLPRRPGTPPRSILPKRPGTPPGASRGHPVRPLTSSAGSAMNRSSFMSSAKRAELERAARLRREMMFKHPERFMSTNKGLVGEDVEDEEEDSDMDSFIDDTEYDDGGEVGEYRDEIRKMFKYDPKRFKYDDDDDPMMESSFGDILKEEARSARLGLLEDLEDIQREQEMLKRKKIKK